jgi:hypothetical protein
MLKILQILGLFPIKKSSEDSCGFEAMPTGKYIFLTLTVQSLGCVIDKRLIDKKIKIFTFIFDDLWQPTLCHSFRGNPRPSWLEKP